ncbi:MAG TPA: hypothetical protein PK559_00455 [Ignavibacteriaceae bacterium]|nr:hypothetical protein [Ignavibacteriaceae bacterium]
MQATISGWLNHHADLANLHLEVPDYNMDEDLTVKKSYYELNLNDHWYTNSSWSGVVKKNVNVMKLVKPEKGLPLPDKDYSEKEGIPVFGKYSGWHAKEGDFYVNEELPDNTQILKSKIDRLKKIKYQLTTFLFGTLLLITLASSIVARY